MTDLIENWSGKNKTKEFVEQSLLKLDLLIAIQNEESYEGQSWFLFREKETGKYFEFYGSHCSCYGYEDQFELEESSVEYLKEMKFSYRWDNNEKIRNYISNL